MKVLLLRFDAPLVSFGAPMVDHNGVVQSFPALAMLAGLIANALGWHHRDAAELTALQGRIRYAARIDRRGEPLVDYQTVDLGQAWMLPERAGWTTRGRIATRGGANAEGTHQRWRHYRADSIHTTAITFIGDGSPCLEEVASALDEPVRPLFIGRKCCLPASRIRLAFSDAPSLVDALATTPRAARADSGLLPVTWWDGDEADATVGQSRAVPVTDERDWHNQIHTGRRIMREGLIDPPAVSRA